MSNRMLFARIAKRTGLNKRTIRDLLRSGWTYREGPDHFPYFLHPAYKNQFKEK